MVQFCNAIRFAIDCNFDEIISTFILNWVIRCHSTWPPVAIFHPTLARYRRCTLPKVWHCCQSSGIKCNYGVIEKVLPRCTRAFSHWLTEAFGSKVPEQKPALAASSTPDLPSGRSRLRISPSENTLREMTQLWEFSVLRFSASRSVAVLGRRLVGPGHGRERTWLGHRRRQRKSLCAERDGGFLWRDCCKL